MTSKKFMVSDELFTYGDNTEVGKHKNKNKFDVNKQGHWKSEGF